MATLVTGASVSLVGKVVGRGVHVVGQVFLARLLGPALFGLYAIGWTLLRIVSLVAPIGLPYGVLRYIPRYWRRDAAGLQSVLFQSLGLALLSGVFIGAALFFAAPWLGLSLFHSAGMVLVIRLFAAAIPLAALLRVAAAATQATQRMQYAVYAQELGQPAANLVLLFLVWLAGGRLLGAVGAAVLSFAVAVFLALRYLRRLYPEAFSRQAHRPWLAAELVRFSMPASFAGIFTLLILWVDRLILGYYRPAAEVGIYQAASQSAVLVAFVLDAFGAIVPSMLGHIDHAREAARLEEIFRLSTKWALYVSLPAFLVMAFAPRELMTVVFGSAYELGWAALVIMSIGQLVNAATGPVNQVLIMTGRQDRLFVISGVMLALNVALNVICIPRWGLVGAAAATSVAVAGLFLWGLAEVRRSLRVWPYDRRFGKMFVAAVVAAAALLGLRGFSLPAAWVRLLVTVAAGTSVFYAILWAAGLDAEDREFLRLLRARLRPEGRSGSEGHA